MVEGSNPSGPAIKLHAEPAAHDLRLNEGGPVDSEKGPLLDLEARLAKPCLFPFDGEPCRLTECQQASSSNAEAEAIVFF